ncbi:MAG: helix-turn-helix transcriptional regulator [Clostridia bacterium]|nr:helix-turn-helix transcriptional regulator [Clostridia bacterium]
MEKHAYCKYADEQILFKYEKTENCAGEQFNAHSHAVFEFLLILQGDVQYTVRGKEYRLQKNDFVITRASEMHRINPVKHSTYERYNVLFDEKRLPFDILEKLPADTDVVHLHHAGAVLSVFEKMRDCAENADEDLQKLMLMGLMQELVATVLLATRQEHKKVSRTPANNPAYEAVRYIENHFETIKDIDEIANALYITKSHLHHLFIRHMGISPKKYIVSRRLSVAEKEIYEGAKPTEIYEKYGFSDYSAFYRAYKKQFGKSPADKTALYFGAEELY